MLKVLIKKQINEFFIMMFGLNRSKKNSISKIGFIALFIFLYTILGLSMYFLGKLLVTGLFMMNLDWLYYVYMIIMASVIGIVGSVFATYSSIYVAKDNDLLLSMPIKKSDIIISRLVGVYIVILAFEALIMIPMLLAVILNASMNIMSFIANMILLFVLPLFAVIICCLFGYVIAFISSKTSGNKKTLVQTLVSLVFMVVYLFFYSGLNNYIQSLVTNALMIANTFKNSPLYFIGQGASGNLLNVVVISVILIVASYLVVKLLDRNFDKLSTTNKGSKVSKKKVELKQSSQGIAIFKKEVKMFTSNSTYMINASIGSVFVLIMPFLIGFTDDINLLLEMLESFDPCFDELMVLGIVCGVVGMNMISSVSISFERHNIWQYKVLPIHPYSIVRRKVEVHMIFTFIPAMISCILFMILLPLDFDIMLIVLIAVYLWCHFCAQLGIVINLFLPKVDFVSEVAAVKQNFSGFLGMMLPIFVILVFGLLYYILQIKVLYFLFILIFIIFIMNRVLLMIQRKMAEKVFMKL